MAATKRISTARVITEAEAIHARGEIASNVAVAKALNITVHAVSYHKAKAIAMGYWNFPKVLVEKIREALKAFREGQDTEERRELENRILAAAEEIHSRCQTAANYVGFVPDAAVAEATGVTRKVVAEVRQHLRKESRWPYLCREDLMSLEFAAGQSKAKEEMRRMREAAAEMKAAYLAAFSRPIHRPPVTLERLFRITASEREMLNRWNEIARERDRIPAKPRRRKAA